MVRANDHHSGQKTLKDSTPSVNVIKVQTLSVITIKHQGNMAHRYNLDRDPNILSTIFTGYQLSLKMTFTMVRISLSLTKQL